MNEEVLLDTNVLLLLANIDVNDKVNLCALRRYLSDKNVVVSYVSIFEILNNKNHRYSFPTIIDNVTKTSRNVSFIGGSGLDSYCPLDLLPSLREKSASCQIEIYKRIGHYITEIFASFYANLFASVPSMMLQVFLNFENENTNKEIGFNQFAKFIQDNFEKMVDCLFDYLKKSLMKAFDDDNFNEKQRNIIFSNLYYEVVEYYAKPYNSSFNRLDKNAFSFEHLMRLSDKATEKLREIPASFEFKSTKPFEEYSLFHSLLKENSGLSENIERYLTKLVGSFCSEKDIANGYLNDLFRRTLTKLTFNNTVIKSNDLLDALLTDCLFLKGATSNEAINRFVSFDKDFVKKLSIYNCRSERKIIINETLDFSL